MRWNKVQGKLRFETASTNLKTYLEINIFDFFDLTNETLIPYLTLIMELLNKKIIQKGGMDAPLLTRIDEVYKLFDYGTKKILADATLDLVSDLEISTKHEIVPDYIPYNQEIFILVWTNFLSGLCVRLKFQYANLFKQAYKEHEELMYQPKCSRGQTEHDFESWRSDIYPDDEVYDRTNWERVDDAWGGHSWHKYRVKKYRIPEVDE